LNTDFRGVCDMDVRIVYPIKKHRRTTFEILRQWLIILFIIGGAVCVICDLCIPGVPFSLCVLGGEWLFYRTFLHRAHIEARFASHFAQTVLWCCGYLFLLTLIFGKDWAGFVLPIIGFSLVIAMGIFFVADLFRRKLSPLPLLSVSAAGLLTAVLLLILDSLRWPTVVLLSVSVGMLTVVGLFSIGPLGRELKKRFHR